MRERERERETEKKARTFGCAGLNRDPVRGVPRWEKEKKKRSEKCDASAGNRRFTLSRARLISILRMSRVQCSGTT